MTAAATRKAALRNSPHWLDALELGPGPLRPNAAEIWAAQLPDVAIYARRRELHERTEAPVIETVATCPSATAPLPRHRSAVADAFRNAGLLVAVAAVLAACAHWL